MSIRIRKIGDVLVALCAARSVEKPGDRYLDDAEHHALHVKFELDLMSEGRVGRAVYADSEEARVMEQEESNNSNRTWWDSVYGAPPTSTVRYHETPASADFHVLKPVEYVISITPNEGGRAQRRRRAGPAMRCPECISEGKESWLRGDGGTQTLLGFAPWYDEAGAYHWHNPNRITETFRCSRGHTFSESWLEPCPNCDYGATRQQRVPPTSTESE